MYQIVDGNGSDDQWNERTDTCVPSSSMFVKRKEVGVSSKRFPFPVPEEGRNFGMFERERGRKRRTCHQIRRKSNEELERITERKGGREGKKRKEKK